MLDTDTKRRIDTARDILVGKVPDPKSQVEQITIALIYKFMDDMDAEAEELGGKRKFFTGDFTRFGWAKLLRAGLGGHEMLNLYAEGITTMPQNPGIPPLFRDIFKNAYLPYRDPETLKSFLKVIDEFSYDHSERLGDAFEYLLSVLGSQGDAGQFRTPRHIIDFIVSIVDPKKDETILDPACGTAGFLISAYKHVLNSAPDAKGKPTLTPDEKGKLAQNLKGYDISPDMVRLSLVNLYLHGFTDPHIFEYDTLTQEERWNELADVILANPPFMSPKGGIKPHKKFSIDAKRSEVLFVDYMAEHLTANGRAGIIVPEGIIFQSQGAYKDLRKMLVKNSLVAVISLPAGCFNPYSGVKTSILILDKSLSKLSDTIGFFKVENDGFGLGAQRRAMDGSDLPQVKSEIDDYFHALRSHQPTGDLSPRCGLIVPKEKIAENDDCNLSGERYRDVVANLTTFPLAKLEEVFTSIGNGVNVNQIDEKAKYRVSRIQTISDGSVNLDKTKFTNDEVNPESFLKSGDILLSHINSFDHLGKTAIFQTNDADVIHGINLVRLVPNTLRIDPRYAIRVFKTDRFIDTVKSFAQKAVNQASVRTSDLRAIQIPLPPLEVQKVIVAEIDGYQKVIDGARSVLDNYHPHIPIHPGWSLVPLAEICSFKNGLNFTSTSSGYTAKIIGVGDFKTNLYAPLANLSEVHLDEPLPDDYRVKHGDILFVRSNGNSDLVGRSMFIPPPLQPTTFSGFTIRGRIEDERALPLFYAHFFKSRDFAEMIKTVGQGANIRNLSQGILNELKVPLPPIAVQQSIVAEIEAEQALVAANHQLIALFEKKIQATVARVWGEDAKVEQEEVV